MVSTNYSILFLMMLSLLCGCQNESDEEESHTDRREANIVVKYEDRSVLHIDHNAEVYVYYGIYSMDLSDYIYSSDGIFVSKYPDKDQRVVPDIRTNINGKDDITLMLENTEKITILVESSRYPQKVITDSYSPNDLPIKATYIFRQ